MDEGARGGGYARVRLPLIIIPDRMALIDVCHTRAGSAGTPISGVTSGGTTVPLSRVSSHPLSLSLAHRHITSIVTRRLCSNPERGCARERLDAILSRSQFG